MKHALYRIKTVENTNLDKDEYVHEMMKTLMEKYPDIRGYQFERVDPIHIHVLIWGDIDLD